MAKILELQLQHRSFQWTPRPDPLGWTGLSPWITLCPPIFLASTTMSITRLLASILVSLLPALHPATRVIFKTNQIWSFPSSINKRAISYNQHSLAGSPPTCLSPPHNVHFSPSLSLPTPTSTSSLALCCGFCFFFLGCANAHPHARVFAHALTPVLTVLPPWLFQRSKSHAHDLFPMTMPCPSYWRSCPYPPPHTHLL